MYPAVLPIPYIRCLWNINCHFLSHTSRLSCILVFFSERHLCVVTNSEISGSSFVSSVHLLLPSSSCRHGMHHVLFLHQSEWANNSSVSVIWNRKACFSLTQPFHCGWLRTTLSIFWDLGWWDGPCLERDGFLVPGKCVGSPSQVLGFPPIPFAYVLLAKASLLATLPTAEGREIQSCP